MAFLEISILLAWGFVTSVESHFACFGFGGMFIFD